MSPKSINLSEASSERPMPEKDISESRCWLGRQVSHFKQWRESHPYLALALIVGIALGVFAVLALSGLAGGLPLFIAGAVAGGILIFGGGAQIAALFARSQSEGGAVEEISAQASEAGGNVELNDAVLENFKEGGEARLSSVQLQNILQNKNLLNEGAAKAVYAVNDHVVLMRAKPCQQAKLDKEIERARQIHETVEEQEPGAKIFLATDYVPVAGHPGLYLAKRCLGDLEQLLKEKLEIPNDLVVSDELVTMKEGKRFFKLNFVLALQLLGDILTGFKQLHGAGYSHGDIKPENILIRFDVEEGRLVALVNDFGETRHMETQGDAVLHGDWRYSSPEQRAHQPSDVYGLGLVAMRVLEQACGIGEDSSDSIERCFPVQDRRARAFMKTGIARLGGVFGRIVYRPETKIHEHVTSLAETLRNRFGEGNEQKLAAFMVLQSMLYNMTKDLPFAEGEQRFLQRATIQEALGDYNERIAPHLLPQPA